VLEYLGVIVLFVVMVGLAWEIARRRAKAERAKKELEPYALLGADMEGVAHDSRKLLRDARESLALMALKPGEDPGELLDKAEAQVKQAESFLFAMGSAPEMVTELDAVGCLRLVASLQRRRQRIDTEDIGGVINVVGRPGDLSRLFSNLMVNALEHSEDDTVVVRTDGNSVYVENPLHGDAPSQEIYQKGTSSSGPGRGLGLALASQMAERLGARLSHEVIQRDGQDWISFCVQFEDDEGKQSPG